MPEEYDGQNDYGDGDKPTPSRAQALREAAHEPVPDFRVPDEAEGDEPPAPAEAEGTSPKAEPEALSEEGEGTSPEADRDAEAEEAEAFLSEVDTTDWTDEERKALGQYKGDPREVVRALLATKRHSNEQAQQLKALSERGESRPAADAGGPPPAAEAERAKPPSSGEQALPESPDVQRLKVEMKARYDAHETAKGQQQKIREEKQNRDSQILKLEGKIEYLQDALKAPELPEYERDATTSRLETLRRELGGLQLEQTKADIALTQLDITRSRLADEFDLVESRLTTIVERAKTEAQSRRDRETRLKEQADVEYGAIQQALDATVNDYQIPEDRVKRFKERLLKDADAHDGTIRDWRQFFKQSARDILDLGRPAGQPERSYADEKRAQARQPAPRGDRATAPVPKDEAPLTRKEARKRLFQDSRRIPIQGA